MALIDLYPGVPTTPGVPALPRFAAPSRQSLDDALRVLLIATVGSTVAIWLASKWLPKTSVYAALVSQGASGAWTTAKYEADEREWVGKTGTTISALRPGGKAQFGETILNVMTEGDMLAKGQSVRVISFSAGTAVVEKVKA
jgi:membrane-bound serine protease (ClpP class)